jgi:Bacteriophage probable baseplate hub protein
MELRRTLIALIFVILVATAVALFPDARPVVVLHAQGNGLTVRIDGVKLSSGLVLSIVADSETDNPDAAVIALRPDTSQRSFHGRGLDIATVDGQSVFNGEIVEIAAAADPSDGPVVTVRALNRIHRLTRQKQTRSFDESSDADIARQLAAEAGLQAETPGIEASIRHPRVHQDNQTDFEFLLDRAARIGYDVFVDGTTLHFQRRRLGLPTAIGCSQDGVFLEAFFARLSSAGNIAEVTVRGWDALRKEEIVGRARQGVIALSRAAADTGLQPPTLDLGFVEGLQTAAASHAVAAGALSAITARNISGEMSVEGDASLRARGRVVLAGAGSAFDGEYYVTQVSHRLGQEGGNGWRTLLRVVRTDRALFVLPEVGDEVLVAFEHGDLARPVVVGSLWNGESPSSDLSPCGRRRN